MRELNFGELSAICSNLSKGCQKQYLPEEAELFFELSEYFLSKVKKNNNIDNSFDNLLALVEQDLNENYKLAVGISTEYKDRGALRALAWGEKVTKVLKSLLVRFNKDKNSFGENTGIYVCEICGFIYLGEDLPDVCPVCKVPKFKINKVVRG
jgi:rubrerythrin